MNYSSATNLKTSREMQLWQKAVPINKARTDLAPRELIEDLEGLSEITMASEINAMLKVSRPQTTDFMRAANVAVQTAAKASTERQEIERKISQHFLSLIRGGKLRCFAFEPPRKMTSEPIEMQVEHWTAFPLWKTGEFKANGLHLIELRVIETEAALERAETPVQVKKGRPTIKNHVMAAFDALLADGRINTDISAKSHFPMVKDWIAQHDTKQKLTVSNMSDEGIRAHFSPLFNALKENRKQ